ncbi:hypothetical protein F0562_000536 [Nyssa sinensis]|uniref:AAA+ ATPase domain-containing protein n=1 Tax=Nyssa sinensis TaxID=561372 RepID=A0A5J5C4M8_9ASTE|nr:hypothetical protein F0562_000536 [Nyssa sinensis]
MAETVVSFVVERLGILLIDEAKFLYGVRDQVEQVQTEFRRMHCFLKDADTRQIESERVRNWVWEVKEIAYDAEDAVETFIFQVASRRGRGIRIILKRFTCLLNEARLRRKVGLEIQAIQTRISDLTRSLQTYGIKDLKEGEGSSSASERRRLLRRSYSHVDEDDFVGLLNDVGILVAELVTKNTHCPLVSICGMGGLGKTTIAKKVYHHRDVRRHFDSFAWVCVSQQWKAQDILQEIVKKLIPEISNKEIMEMTVDELFKKVYEVQKQKKCLVVLDDIWSEDFWNILKNAFPNEKIGSKILLTTRNKDVALHVDPNGFLHQPRYLNEDESWELLQKKALRRRDGTDSSVDIELEKLGRKMAGQCGGLPLAVVVLGGVLATKHTLDEWETVNQNVNLYFRKGKGHDQEYSGVSDILALSYHDLPYQFKSCFLYLGNFPEDSEIPAEKLCQQLVAEDLVSFEEIEEEETRTNVAERYLHELAHRCMIQVQVKESTDRIKSCRLHDLMREFCLSKVKEENFLKVIDFRHGNEPVESTSSSTTRRIALYLHTNVDTFVLPTQGTTQHLRSALFFAPYGLIDEFLPKMKSFFEEFKLLRVLDFGKGITGRLPKAIGKLLHLRYLSFNGSGFAGWASFIGKLKYLETLDLRVILGDISVPNRLWKMERLRHLYLPLCFSRRIRLDGLRDLEILVNFYSDQCDVRDLLKLTKLRKLKATLEFNELGTIINYLSVTANYLRRSSFTLTAKRFCSEEDLTLLCRLLECHHLHKLKLWGPIGKLPDDKHFSPRLTFILLGESRLEKDPMVTLGKVPNLRILILAEAFVGEEMVCSTMSFPQLRRLDLVRLENLEEWRVDEGAMPNLSTLRIEFCEKLKMVPDGLRFVTSLEEFTIGRMPKEFKNRLRLENGEEGEDFYKVGHVPNITIER